MFDRNTLVARRVRRSELIHLDVRDFDEKQKRMTVHKGKGGKTRVIVIINDEYLSDLLMLIGSRKTGPIFLGNRHRAMSLRSVNRVVATLGAQAEMMKSNPRLTHLNIHLFRHSIARFLKSKRFSAEWIQNFLGHESYRSTMDMYGTLSIDEMREVAQRLLDFPIGGFSPPEGRLARGFKPPGFQPFSL